MKFIIPMIISIIISVIVSLLMYKFYIVKSKNIELYKMEESYKVLIALHHCSPVFYIVKTTERWLGWTSIVNIAFIGMIVYTLRENKKYSTEDVAGGYLFLVMVLFMIMIF